MIADVADVAKIGDVAEDRRRSPRIADDLQAGAR
jgi:hypothetical protein